MAENKWMTQLIKAGGIAVSQMKKKELPVIPSWSPSLNWSTTIGGFRPGKVAVLFGPESAGKSLLALMALIELQRRDSEAIGLYFDTEFSFNTDLFIKLGGDADRLKRIEQLLINANLRPPSVGACG